MDFRTLTEGCVAPCAVISVEMTEDAKRGDMRIAHGNQAFRDMMGPACHDGTSCDELLPTEANFEDLCVRSAVLGQRVHTYVHDETRDVWMDLTLFPLVREQPEVAYCLLFIEESERPDPERMAAVSMDTAAAAVKASIALLGAEDLHQGVREVLDDIIVRSGGFSARLTLVDHELREAHVFCEAFVKGFFDGEELPEVPVPYESVVNWERMLEGSSTLLIECDADFDAIAPYDPEWVATLRSFGVNSFIMCAMRTAGGTIGYLQLSNFDVSRVLEVKELVELITFLLNAQISNHLLMERLERLSTRDNLTSLLNRHAMTQRIVSMSEDAGTVPFGIISVDLNGLKAVNDQDGHDAGDRLLMQASDVLRETFSDEELFRTGGDEFTVIVCGIGRDEFEHKVARLRAEVEGTDAVSFAIGACWSDGTRDVHTASLVADEQMYADKDAYYLSVAGSRRR